MVTEISPKAGKEKGILDWENEPDFQTKRARTATKHVATSSSLKPRSVETLLQDSGSPL